MTDRINSFTVVLDDDVRDDDIEPIVTALRMVRHVTSVEPHVADIADHVAAVRARHDLGQRILDVVMAEVYPNRRQAPG